MAEDPIEKAQATAHVVAGDAAAKPAPATTTTTTTTTTKTGDDLGIEQLGTVTSAGYPDDLPTGSGGGGLHRKAGLATIQQQYAIPATGNRKMSSKWEYYFFCAFYFSMNGAPIGNSGYSLAQALVSLQFPEGKVTWGGQTQSMNAMLLDISGILFAVQLVILLTIGPYADYGKWRAWIMIFFQTLLYITQFAMCGLSRPDEWQVALALYVIGCCSTNVVTAFYSAEFPAIVRDLPKMIESEQEVQAGVKSPELHGELESYERSKLFNLCNIVGSAEVVVAYSAAVGISAGVGYATNQQLIHSYVVLLGYFSALTFLFTVPFFIVQKHRPGQQLPAGVPWYLVGPKQVWSAAKAARQLKNCMIYLLANFMIQETFGTYFNVSAILQNEVVNYNPLLNTAMTIVSDLAGGLGTLFFLLLQKRFRFTVKSAVIYGAVMTLIPNLWGGIGMFTSTIGFHHVWEFWLASSWNFMTAAWGSYQVTMVTEVVPAPKAYMFFALFNTVSKTSGFIGPFISSAIIERAHGDTCAAFWFLFAMGAVGTVILCFVNPDEAKADNAKYLEREAGELYSEEQRVATRGLEMSKLGPDNM